MDVVQHQILSLDFWQDTVSYEGKIFPYGTIAVSYTHLDVYKRQGVPCVCKGVREVPPEGILEQSRLHKTAGFAPAQTPCPESAQRRLRFLQGSARASDSPPVRQRRYPPVSYTHLDVYKRQVLKTRYA